MCPENREVSLIDLSINPSTQVMYYDWDDERSYFIGGDSSSPRLISNFPEDARFLNTSPNARWFLYEMRKVFNSDNYLSDIYISSIDGEENWKIFSDIENRYAFPHWHDDETIVILEPDRGPYNSCYQRNLAINPFTLNTWIPEPEPVSGFPFCSPYIRQVSSDNSKVLYLNNSSRSWYMHDYSTDSTYEVFSWLSMDEYINLSELKMNWSSNGFTIVRHRPPDEIDIVYNLPVSRASEAVNPIQRISLPGKLWSLSIAWLSSDGSLVGLDLVSPDVDLESDEHIVFGSPSNFYILDLRNMIFYDYCINRQHSAGIIIESSTDSRYLAWDTAVPDTNSLDIIILELDSGRFARLSRKSLYGWGMVVDEEP